MYDKEQAKKTERLLDAMADKIEGAEQHRQKSAMLALQILLNADDLYQLDAHYIARRLRLKPSWYIEVRKMLTASALMDEEGIQLVNKT